ncbi:MAG: hypothetical protein P4L73_20705 [Caulobacteraceae bacterium]|nr:hypothetical protein [Caulobacteraceae bacterium]
MVSKADAKRRRRARAIARATAAKAVQAGASAPAAVMAPAAARARRRSPAIAERDDGMDFLLSRGRITGRQADAGRIYAMLWRTAQISGSAALRSCLDDTPRGSGAGAIPTTDLAAAEWIAEARMRLVDAQVALGHHVGMVATVDLICGRGLRPRQITTVQRESEEIETTLRVALDLLERHFRSHPGRLTANARLRF